MNSPPLVSVVTPSFNQAQYIEETLRSVELQEYRPIHQIVIDGGSTDGTVELLKNWEKRDHGDGYAFEWISEKDRGHADALNKGFDRVRGEVVGWLNSDDVYFDREAVGSSVAAFEAHPDVDAVFGDVALISENSGLQMILCYPEFRYKRVVRGYMVSQPTVFLRRTVTDTYRLDPSLRVAIDFIYWLDIGKELKFLKIPRIQAGDRDQPGRITRVSYAALMETAKKARMAYGAKAKESWAERLQDLMTLRLLRVTALLRLLPLLAQKERLNRLAFPLWTDSALKTLTRQLTMRVNDRTDLGPRPSPPPAAFGATE
jgi:glycosyltransferase involved in cell wall biosynthesis